MRYVIVISLAFVLFVSCRQEKKQNVQTGGENTSEQKKTEEESLFSIIAVGDIMMGTTYPSKDLPPNDGETLFDDISDVLQSADFTMGNLEGPFLNSGGTPKQCRDSAARCYSFRVPERYCAYLKKAGFNYMNLANNHAGDMGEAGRTATYNALDENGILYAGTTDYPYVVAKVKGLKVGIAGFAPNRGTVNINDLEYAGELIKEIKSKCDIVIVMFHGGAEGAGAQHVPRKEEVFLGENRGDVYEFAHTVIDAGADVVFGSGPHVTRAVEIY
ncbi:MAG: CapA family protein, partial [Bacteroidetes bacterium]|nr:CapA family protein [Bacteroidota bacterium]